LKLRENQNHKIDREHSQVSKLEETINTLPACLPACLPAWKLIFVCWQSRSTWTSLQP
jgi:hypothetical protein